MTKFDKTFKFTPTSEIKNYIRECFKAIQMGRAYHSRIVIKDRIIGYNIDNQPVREYTNRDEVFYLIDTGSGIKHVQQAKPQMTCEF